MANSAYVSTGKPNVNGAIYRAPVGTPLPTDASSTPNAAFVELGFVSEDGVTNNNTADSDVVNEWGGSPVLTLQTSKPDEWTLTLIESLNPNVLETVYGTDNVTYNAVAGTIAVAANADQLAAQSYVIDMYFTGGAMKRIVIPNGSLSELGEIVYKADEAVGYELTLNALKDSSGNTHYEYIQLASGADASITLSASTLSVAADATAALTATTTPAGGHVLWGTSDASKATVDQSGTVTGVAAGSAVITAYFAGVTATCTVTVT